MTAADPRDGLPELPEPWQCETAMCPQLFTAAQMRAYAEQCLAHARPEAVDAAMVRRANAAYQAARQASFVATEHDCIRAALKAALTPERAP